MLVTQGLENARKLGIGFVVVLGDPGYYARLGFHPAARWGLCDEYGGGVAFQAIEVKSGSIPRVGGLVKYAPEFAAL